jgi:hypothetical protein
MVKPPSKSMMTGFHMAAKTNLVASFESIRRWGGSSVRIIRSITTKNGISSDVTNNGITFSRFVRSSRKDKMESGK